MYPIFDSHAHYDDKKFGADRDEVLCEIPKKGIVRVVNAASDIKSARRCIELAEKYDYIYAAVGIHPHEASSRDEKSADIIREMTKHEKVVAIGEIGLDYHYDFSPREIQRAVFEEQIRLSKELSLPVVIHDREAHGDMYDILRRYAPLTGVVHCFSGSVELARETVKYGLHIGLGGAVTFKNARVPLEVAAYVPDDRLLIETDCPYMAPVPMRGKRCDSSMIEYTAEKLAEARGTTAQEILLQTAENASRLFGITF